MQTLSDINDWRYLPSSDNPVDCAPSGLFPEELNHHALWWTGPYWLKFNAESWATFLHEADTRKSFEYTANKNVSTNAAMCSKNVNNRDKEYPDVTLRFSSFNKLTRVTAYLLRYVDNLRCKRFNNKIDTSLLRT